MAVYQFEAELDGTRIDVLVKKQFPELLPQVIRESFQRRDVKCNGKRVKPDYRVCAGDLIQLYCMEQKTTIIDVVYEDNDVILVNKRAGISVEKDEGDGVTLTDLVTRYVREKNPDASIPAACHRLDNQTCGLILFAKHEKAADILQNVFRTRTLEKHYICLVKGRMKPPKAICHAWLRKDAVAARVFVQDSETKGAKPIITEYETLSSDDTMSRLKVHLVTGRTHQIRAHMAALGHPLLGDDLYGDRSFNRLHHAQGKLMLCAVSLVLETDGALPALDGKRFEIKAPF